MRKTAPKKRFLCIQITVKPQAKIASNTQANLAHLAQQKNVSFFTRHSPQIKIFIGHLIERLPDVPFLLFNILTYCVKKEMCLCCNLPAFQVNIPSIPLINRSIVSNSIHNH
jgi:hypothetical protein